MLGKFSLYTYTNASNIFVSIIFRVALMKHGNKEILEDWWLDPQHQFVLTMNVEAASIDVELSKFLWREMTPSTALITTDVFVIDHDIIYYDYDYDYDYDYSH